MPARIGRCERAVEARGTRFPWALAVAIVIVLAFEGVVRILPPDRLAYGGVGSRGDIGRGYFAYLRDRPPPPDVALIGSSRVRDGLVCASIEGVLAERLGRGVRVQNYGMPAATNGEFDMLAEAVLRAGTPELIVVGIEPRSFVTQHRDAFHHRIDGAPGLLRQVIESGGRDADLRREFGDRTVQDLSRAFAFRGRFSVMGYNMGAHLRAGRPLSAARELTLPVQDLPLTGGTAWNHRRTPDRSLATHPRTAADLGPYIAAHFVGDDPFSVTGPEREPLYTLIERARAAGVPVVFLDLPAPDVLRAAWPAGTAEAYAAEIELLEAHGAEVVALEELGLSLGNEHFREQSHLNLVGARRYSERVAEEVIAPRLTPPG